MSLHCSPPPPDEGGYIEQLLEDRENKDNFLNKFTHFDLREEKYPKSTLAQTVIARIDCSIYNLGNKYIITCNKSFEDYFQQRLKDTASLN